MTTPFSGRFSFISDVLKASQFPYAKTMEDTNMDVWAGKEAEH